MGKRKIDEIETANKILKILFDALKTGQFNFHVAKLKGSKEDGSGEEITETRLDAIDTKRLLETVTAIEKIVNMKNKAESDIQQAEEAAKIVLPEVEFPQDSEGDGQ